MMYPIKGIERFSLGKFGRKNGQPYPIKGIERYELD